MTDDKLFELDIQIAEKVMGWQCFSLEQCLHDGNTPRPHCLKTLVPDGTHALQVLLPGGDIEWFMPSRRIGDAWQVAERMCGSDYMGLRVEFGCGQCWCYFHTVHAGSILGQAYEPTVALAICVAALNTVTGLAARTLPTP